MAVILATLQLILARNTITHDICRKDPIKVYKTGGKYLVIAYGFVSFVMIVIYYIGILMLVKKHLNQFDQKLNGEHSTRSGGGGNGPTPSGRIVDNVSIVEPPRESIQVRQEYSSRSPVTPLTRNSDKSSSIKVAAQTPSSLQVPKNAFVFSNCNKVTPAPNLIPTSCNIQENDDHEEYKSERGEGSGDVITSTHHVGRKKLGKGLVESEGIEIGEGIKIGEGIEISGGEGQRKETCCTMTCEEGDGPDERKEVREEEMEGGWEKNGRQRESNSGRCSQVQVQYDNQSTVNCFHDSHIHHESLSSAYCAQRQTVEQNERQIVKERKRKKIVCQHFQDPIQTGLSEDSDHKPPPRSDDEKTTCVEGRTLDPEPITKTSILGAAGDEDDDKENDDYSRIEGDKVLMENWMKEKDKEEENELMVEKEKRSEGDVELDTMKYHKDKVLVIDDGSKWVDDEGIERDEKKKCNDGENGTGTKLFLPAHMELQQLNIVTRSTLSLNHGPELMMVENPQPDFIQTSRQIRSQSNYDDENTFISADLTIVSKNPPCLDTHSIQDQSEGQQNVVDIKKNGRGRKGEEDGKVDYEKGKSNPPILEVMVKLEVVEVVEIDIICPPTKSSSTFDRKHDNDVGQGEGGSIVNGTNDKEKGGVEGRKRPIFYGPICPLNESNRMKGRRKFEAEIAKRLFYIIASFISFWIPYALLVIALTEFRLVILDDCDLTFELLFCFHILTTLTSVLNPLIYSLPNNQFRSCFNQLRKRNRLICI